MDELVRALRQLPKSPPPDWRGTARALVFGLAAVATTFALIALAVVWAPRLVSGEDRSAPFAVTEQVLKDAVKDLHELTGWATVGIRLPTVTMVDGLTASQPRQVRFGEYNKGRNEIRISRACESQTVVHTCLAALVHELVHWVQRASVSWPGTFLEWELEAQMHEARWLAKEQGRGLPPPPTGTAAQSVAEGRAEWSPAGEKPNKAFIEAKLAALLPPEVRRLWSDQAIASLFSAESGQRDLLLKDGCFLDTSGQRVCAWVLKLLTRVGTTMHGTVVTLRGEQPLSVDLRRFNPITEMPEVLGWWWDAGWLPDQQGRVPAKAEWTGRWIKTRGLDGVGTRAAREGE